VPNIGFNTFVEEQEHQYPFHPLIPELILLVMSFVEPKDRCKFSEVSKECCIYANDTNLWRSDAYKAADSPAKLSLVDFLYGTSTTTSWRNPNRKIGRGPLVMSSKLAYFMLMKLKWKKRAFLAS
jgi:hypothetical protein